MAQVNLEIVLRIQHRPQKRLRALILRVFKHLRRRAFLDDVAVRHEQHAVAYFLRKAHFVRHAQPEHDWKEDKTRPLTEEGKKDSAIVLEFLKDKKIDAFYCSPYKRSMDTIADAAAFFGKEIITDERLREREKGPDGNNHGMFQKR